jgi:hypothetical protein
MAADGPATRSLLSGFPNVEGAQALANVLAPYWESALTYIARLPQRYNVRNFNSFYSVVVQITLHQTPSLYGKTYTNELVWKDVYKDKTRSIAILATQSS